MPIADALAAAQINQMEANCREFGIPLYGLDSPHRGIVHVIGPELGLTQPGMTIVCGDSHTATHGAFGALAFGIGTSEVEHVLATQCLLQRKPKTCEVRVDGTLAAGVTAKDIILALIAQIGIGGGTGHVFEYTGSAIRALTMEERMTVCNMSIEGGARAGMIAPDDTTFEYLAGREFAPKGAAWDKAVARWKHLPTDEGAAYDKSVTLDAVDARTDDHLRHQPRHGHADHRPRPRPGQPARRQPESRAGKGPDLYGSAARPAAARPPGGCGLHRQLHQLAASPTCAWRPRVLKGRKVAAGLRVLVVPGSQEVKQQAEAEGWTRSSRKPAPNGAKPAARMCIAMNGDQLEPGQYAVSTSNRNFEGRQGKGGRTFLASPLTAAASAPSPAQITDVARCLIGVKLLNHGSIHSTHLPRRVHCRSTTSTPTRSSRPAS